MTTCKQIFDVSISDGGCLIYNMVAGSNYILTASTGGEIHKLNLETNQREHLLVILVLRLKIFLYTITNMQLQATVMDK